jgi:hypothetical protein
LAKPRRRRNVFDPLSKIARRARSAGEFRFAHRGRFFVNVSKAV